MTLREEIEEIMFNQGMRDYITVRLNGGDELLGELETLVNDQITSFAERVMKLAEEDSDIIGNQNTTTHELVRRELEALRGKDE